MDITQVMKRRMMVYLKNKAFYQDVVRQNQHLLDMNHESQQIVHHVQQLMSDNRPVLEYFWFVEPGHYYSPLVDKKQLKVDGLLDIESPTNNQKEVDLPGIELHKKEQQALLLTLAKNVDDVPDYDVADGTRYRYDNDQFGRMDAGVLFLMLRHLKPKQIMEVGSGWSSALMLDLNERFPKDAAQLTFIEPYPDRLYSTLKTGDKKHCTITVKPVQEVPLTQFAKLHKGDVLFIDNSHVSKFGSDVNYLFLNVLPSLQKGVIVHVHDIFYPFEYPVQWVQRENRNWNEAYVLHALLIGSSMFEIMFWPSYLKAVDQKKFEQHIPTAFGHGGSIWLRKIS